MNDSFKLLEQAFAPDRVSLTRPRPDGSVVFTLCNPKGESLARRVITAEQLTHNSQLTWVINGIKRDVSTQNGGLAPESLTTLRRGTSVLHYSAE